MGIFKELFIWWDGKTISQRLYTSLRGKLVGEDEFGNKYYIQRKGKGPLGKPRRWVIYNGQAEASTVPAAWHGWLHYMVDDIPDPKSARPRPWQAPHRPNMTGTGEAYRPPGSTLVSSHRPPATGDYEPWQPE